MKLGWIYIAMFIVMVGVLMTASFMMADWLLPQFVWTAIIMNGMMMVVYVFLNDSNIRFAGTPKQLNSAVKNKYVPPMQQKLEEQLQQRSKVEEEFTQVGRMIYESLQKGYNLNSILDSMQSMGYSEEYLTKVIEEMERQRLIEIPREEEQPEENIEQEVKPEIKREVKREIKREVRREDITKQLDEDIKKYDRQPMIEEVQPQPVVAMPQEFKDPLDASDEFDIKAESIPAPHKGKPSKEEVAKRNIFADPNKPRFKCQFCGKEYFTEGSWRMHVWRSHNKGDEINKDIVLNQDKKFKCHICGKEYTTDNVLGQHMWKTHRGEQ